MKVEMRIATLVWIALIFSESILTAKAQYYSLQHGHNPNWENCQGVFGRSLISAPRYETYVTPDGDVVTMDPTVPSGFRVYRLDRSGRPRRPKGEPISGTVLEDSGIMNIWNPLREGSVGLTMHYGGGLIKHREFKLGSKVSVAGVDAFEDTRSIELNSLLQPFVREVIRDRGSQRFHFRERQTAPFARVFLGQTDKYYIGSGDPIHKGETSLRFVPKDFTADDPLQVVFLTDWAQSYQGKSDWVRSFPNVNFYVSMDTRFIVGRSSRDQQSAWMLWKIGEEGGGIKTRATAEEIQGSLGTDAVKNLHWTRNTLLGISGSGVKASRGMVGLWKIYLSEGKMSSLRLPEESSRQTLFDIATDTPWATDQNQNTYFTYLAIANDGKGTPPRDVIGVIGEKGIEVKKVFGPLPVNEKVVGLTLSGNRRFLVVITRKYHEGNELSDLHPALRFRSVPIDGQ